jgi:hypothetical protein
MMQDVHIVSGLSKLIGQFTGLIGASIVYQHDLPSIFALERVQAGKTTDTSGLLTLPLVGPSLLNMGTAFALAMVLI